MKTPTYDAVILAAGTGTRFAKSGGETYKQLVPFRGVPLIQRIVDTLRADPHVGNITVVLGEDEMCAQAIQQTLADQPISYVRNENSVTDNNLVSFWKGVEHSENGVIILEADCVFEAADLAALLLNTGDEEICWSNIGDLSRHRSGGVISVNEDGEVDRIMILDAGQMEEFKTSGGRGFKMYGLTVMGRHALSAYRKKIRITGLRPHQYFHVIAMESFGEFRHTTVAMSPSAFSFNTVEEYQGENSINMCLAPVAELSPIEGHSTKRRDWLAKKIQDEGVWKVPLRVERSKMLVMDGHHRLAVAKLLQLRQVPVFYHRYEDVSVYSLRKNVAVTSGIIMRNADKGLIFPYKTAKHDFLNEQHNFEGISLDELR